MPNKRARNTLTEDFKQRKMRKIEDSEEYNNFTTNSDHSIESGDIGNDTEIVQRLVQICDKGDEIELNSLLAKYAQQVKLIIDLIIDEKTFLHRAIQNNSLECITTLINFGAKVFTPVIGGVSLITSSCTNETFAHLLDMIENNTESSVGDYLSEFSSRLLYYSIFRNKKYFVQEILRGTFKNYLNIQYSGLTPLFLAAGKGCIEITDYLINNGADIYALSSIRSTVLHAAVNSNSYDVVHLIIKKLRSDRDQQSIDEYIGLKSTNSLTAIHFAAIKGFPNILKLLLDTSSASINELSDINKTAIEYANIRGYVDCVKILLNYNAIPPLEFLPFSNFRNQFLCQVELFKNSNLSDIVEEINIDISNSLAKNESYHKLSTLIQKKAFLSNYINRSHVLHFKFQDHMDINQLLEDLEIMQGRMKNYRTSTEIPGHYRYPKIEIRIESMIAEGEGMLKSWFLRCCNVILKSNIFKIIEGKNCYYLPFIIQEDLPRMKRAINLIGFFFFLSFLYYPIPLKLANPFYNHIFNISSDISEFVDPDLLNSLIAIGEIYNQSKTENDLVDDEISDLELYYSCRTDTSRNVQTINLIPNGNRIRVTKENFSEYEKMYIDFLCIGGGRGVMLTAFKDGFLSLYSICDFRGVFKPSDIKSIISGEDSIDTKAVINDMKSNTKYINCSPDSKEVKYFWENVYGMTTNEINKILEFTMGTYALPIGGFGYLQTINNPFSIELNGRISDKIPTSQTCFHTIVLSKYSDPSVLTKYLHLIVDGNFNSREHFEFV